MRAVPWLVVAAALLDGCLGGLDQDRAHAAVASTPWNRPGTFAVHTSVELPAPSPGSEG